MSVRVINIQKNHECVLSFLFPEYSLERGTDKCIFTEDIKTPERLAYIKSAYRNAVVISRVLYDESWDLDKIGEETLKFCKDRFGSRKKVLKLTEENMLNEVVSAITGIQCDSTQDEGMLELFDSFGTKNFPYKFFSYSERYSVRVLTSSVLTFLTKVVTSPTQFYAKYNKAYSRKIRENLSDALRFYASSDKDEYGISFVMFCMILTKQ